MEVSSFYMFDILISLDCVVGKVVIEIFLRFLLNLLRLYDDNF